MEGDVFHPSPLQCYNKIEKPSAYRVVLFKYKLVIRKPYEALPSGKLKLKAPPQGKE